MRKSLAALTALTALAAVTAVAAVAAPLRAQEQSSPPAPHLAAGPRPVGFTRFTRSDSARPLPSGKVRALDIGVWYPARAPAAVRQTLRAYFPPDSSEASAFAAFVVSHGASDSAVGAWLDAPTLATLDPAPAGGRFPLLLLAQGNGQALHDQAPLAEYLSSYGYIVATSPSPMRISGPLTDEESVGARAEEQADDLAFVARVLAGRPDVARGRIGLVAHSFGARGALLLAMRDPAVAALVSLDGGIGTATARASFEHAPSFKASATRAPILHLYERQDAFMAPDLELLRSLRGAERWTVEAPALHHHLFTNLGAAAIEQPALRPALGASDAAAAAYAAVARATLAFLDAFVKRDTAARGLLERGDAWPPLGSVERLR